MAAVVSTFMWASDIQKTERLREKQGTSYIPCPPHHQILLRDLSPRQHIEFPPLYGVQGGLGGHAKMVHFTDPPRDPAPWGSYLILFSTVMLDLGMVLPDPLLLPGAGGMLLL